MQEAARNVAYLVSAANEAYVKAILVAQTGNPLLQVRYHCITVLSIHIFFFYFFVFWLLYADDEVQQLVELYAQRRVPTCRSPALPITSGPCCAVNWATQQSLHAPNGYIAVTTVCLSVSFVCI